MVVVPVVPAAAVAAVVAAGFVDAAVDPVDPVIVVVVDVEHLAEHHLVECSVEGHADSHLDRQPAVGQVE